MGAELVRAYKHMTTNLVELTACPICGGTSFETAKKRRLHEYGIVVSYSICDDCGQFFLNPRMTDEDLANYYRGEFRDITLTNKHQQLNDRMRQKQRAEIQKDVINRHGKYKSHIEIGCSAGYLMDAMRIKYTVGVDPDTTFRDMLPASKYKIYNDLSDVPPRVFDLITMSHSLEHFNHPDKMITDLARSYARPGTIIMAEVPNAEVNDGAFTIHHPYAFSREIMVRLFERCACRPREVAFHGMGLPNFSYLIGVFEVV